MNSARLLLTVDEFVVQFLFWAGVAFVTITSTFWPWWQTDLGRTTVMLELSLTTALFPSEMHLIFGMNTDSTFWQWWVAATFFVAALVVLWRIPVIWRYQRNRKG